MILSLGIIPQSSFCATSYLSEWKYFEHGGLSETVVEHKSQYVTLYYVCMKPCTHISSISTSNLANQFHLYLCTNNLFLPVVLIL